MAPRLAKALSKFRVTKNNPPWRKIDNACGDLVFMVCSRRGLRLWCNCNFWACCNCWVAKQFERSSQLWFGVLSMQLADTGRCRDSSFESREGCTTSHFKTANGEGKFRRRHPRISAAICPPGLSLWQVPGAGHYYTFHCRGDDEQCKARSSLAFPPVSRINLQSYIHHMVDSVHGIFGDRIRNCEVYKLCISNFWVFWTQPNRQESEWQGCDQGPFPIQFQSPRRHAVPSTYQVHRFTHHNHRSTSNLYLQLCVSLFVGQHHHRPHDSNLGTGRKFSSL